MFVVPACPYTSYDEGRTGEPEAEDIENTPLSKWHGVYFVK
jgi:hypothetical protein